MTRQESPLLTFAKGMGEDGENFAVLASLSQLFSTACELGLVKPELRLTPEGERLVQQALGFEKYMKERTR